MSLCILATNLSFAVVGLHLNEMQYATNVTFVVPSTEDATVRFARMQVSMTATLVAVRRLTNQRRG